MSVLRQADARDARMPPGGAAARREQILEVALEAISRKGFRRTSIADIARGARTSRATTYQYFDKQDILAAIGERVETRIIRAVDTWMPLPSGADAEQLEHEPRLLTDRFRSMIDAPIRQVMSVIFANADAARLVLRRIRGYDGVIDGVMRRIDARGHPRARTRDGDPARPGRACDAETTARYLLGASRRS